MIVLDGKTAFAKQKSSRMMRSKAQVSVELVVLVSFITFLFSAYYLATIKKSVDAYYDATTLEATKVARQLALVLDIVYTNGNGYSQIINLPPNILGSTYDINVRSNLVIINMTNRFIYVRTLVDEVNGDFSKGEENIIRNVGGEIYVVH